MGKIVHIDIPICEPPYIFITPLHKLHKLPQSTCSLLQALCTLNPLSIAARGYSTSRSAVEIDSTGEEKLFCIDHFWGQLRPKNKCPRF